VKNGERDSQTMRKGEINVLSSKYSVQYLSHYVKDSQQNAATRIKTVNTVCSVCAMLSDYILCILRIFYSTIFRALCACTVHRGGREAMSCGSWSVHGPY
jgi:hypothetical protein